MRAPWLFTRSLLYPLTAVLVALAVLPVALAGWGFLSSNREQVATLEKQYLTRHAVGLAREMELFFLDSAGRIEAVAQVLGPSSGQHVVSAGSPAILAQLVRGNRNVIMVRLLDASGHGPFVQNRALSVATERALDPVLGDAFTANLRGKPVRQDLLRLSGEAPMMLVSLPLVNGEGAVSGAMQGVISLEALTARLADEGGQGVTVDVVDKRGEVLFSSEAARVGRSARSNPLVGQFLAAPVRLTKTYHDPLRTDEAEVLGSLCPMESPSWAVVTERDVGVAFAAVRGMAERTALLAVATGLVATLAGVLLARRITLPLRHLADVTSAVTRGDYSRRVPVASRNELGQLGGNFNTMAAEIDRHIRSLRRALQENEELLVDSIRALAAAIDAKSPYTRGHSERVSRYALAIARHHGVEPAVLRKVEIAALLHDVGKIGIDDAILAKPEALTESEFAQMQAHPLKGAAIVSPIKHLKDMLPGIRSHHENWGGGGYPDGLVGEQIPLIARIIAIADVFDAMTTHRPYQRAISLDVVLARIREMGGTRFDPSLLEAFFAAVRVGELVPLGQMEVA